MLESLDRVTGSQLALYATAQQQAKYLSVASLAFIVYDEREFPLPVRTVPSPFPSYYVLSRGRPMSLINPGGRITENTAKAGICLADPSIHDCEGIIPNK
jgi:hypothetical protein